MSKKNSFFGFVKAIGSTATEVTVTAVIKGKKSIDNFNAKANAIATEDAIEAEVEDSVILAIAELNKTKATILKLIEMGQVTAATQYAKKNGVKVVKNKDAEDGSGFDLVDIEEEVVLKKKVKETE